MFATQVFITIAQPSIINVKQQVYVQTLKTPLGMLKTRNNCGSS